MANDSGGEQPTMLLGRYHVEAALGEGSFGTVVRAYDTRLKRTVAIKTLKRPFARDDFDRFRSIEERFAREAEAGSRMGVHPNLVAVHDLVIEPDRTQYLILEFVQGGTLTERLTQGPLSLEEALRITADVARGLHAAHDVGIVHRDVKPANIFLALDGKAKLGDFGIAQIDDVSGRTHATVGHPGTPLYMSPEQANSTGYVRAASDQYSLGLVFFEMVTGKAYKRLGERAASALLETYPAPVVNLLEDMIASDPDDRLPSLERVIRQVQIIARQQGLAETQYAITTPEIVTERITRRPPGTLIEPPPAPGRLVGGTAGSHDSVTPTVPIGTESRRNPSVAPNVVGSQSVQGAVGGGGLSSGPIAAGSQPPLWLTSEQPVQRNERPRRSRRGPLIASILAVVALLLVGVTAFGFFVTNRGNSAPATATPALTSGNATAAPGGQSAAPPELSTVAPTIQPVVTSAPTLTDVPATVPVATVGVRPALPVLATATVVVPTATATSTLAVFGVGTTDQNLTTVNAEDVVTSFTAGQEIFGFVNFGGAAINTDVLDASVVQGASDAQVLSRSLTLAKSDGFVVFSLGKLGPGDYRLTIRYKGKLAKDSAFHVSAQPTAQPRAPTAVPRPNPTPAPAQPTTAPATSTPAPVTATPAPKPTSYIPPTQKAPTP